MNVKVFVGILGGLTAGVAAIAFADHKLKNVPVTGGVNSNGETNASSNPSPPAETFLTQDHLSDAAPPTKSQNDPLSMYPQTGDGAPPKWWPPVGMKNPVWNATNQEWQGRG